MRQKGFTLLELLVTMAIGSVLMTGAVLGIHQILWGTTRSSSHVVALTDISQAVLAIKKDLIMTQSTNFADNTTPQSSVTLSWTDYSSFASANWTAHTSSYTLSGTNLIRTYGGATSIVGRHITYVGFTKNGRVVTVVITATGSGALQKSETLKFSAYTRAEVIVQ